MHIFTDYCRCFDVAFQNSYRSQPRARFQNLKSALERDLTLYTRNIRHFRMIPQLKVNQPILK